MEPTATPNKWFKEETERYEGVHKELNHSPMGDRTLDDATAPPVLVTPSSGPSSDLSTSQSDISIIYLPDLTNDVLGTPSLVHTDSTLDGSVDHETPLQVPARCGQKSTKNIRNRKPPRNKPKNPKKKSSSDTTTVDWLMPGALNDEHFWANPKALDELEWADDVDNVVCTPKDVLLGRGASTNKHEGNVQFRALAAQLRPDYMATTSKIVKRQVCQRLVTMMKMNGARFLKKQANGVNYFVVLDDIALNKSSQALREDPEVARVRRHARKAERRLTL